MQSTLCEMLGWIESQAGIKIAGRNINNLRHVDYTSLMAENKEELRSLLMRVKKESEKAGLKLNIQSGSPFFVYFGFLCLQVSTVFKFHPDSRRWRGPLIQGHSFSRAVGRGALQPNAAGMCGECSQWVGHTGLPTAHGSRYSLGPDCAGSRVLCKGTAPSGPCISCPSQIYAAQVLKCSARALTQIDCAFYALPRRSGSTFCFEGAQVTGCLASTPSRWPMPLTHLLVPAAPCSGCATRTWSQVCLCLLWGADLSLWHSRQMCTCQDPNLDVHQRTNA